MTRHLLLVHLGPVQDFIIQARRTRDLWFGSHLLSELSRAVARQLAESGALLVFPALEKGHPELEPCDGLLRDETKKPPLGIVNKILAEVPAGRDPRVLALAARKAATGRWCRIGERVRRECQGLLDRDIEAVWNEQMDTLLEFIAAWTALGAGSDGYIDARRDVETSMAGRKLLRDFAPWQHQRRPVPRSSLDGARETVLRSKERDPELARKYRIFEGKRPDEGEHLDSVGLVKRAGGEPDQFVPVTNVTVACWLASASQHAPAELAALRNACAGKKLTPVRRDLPCTKHFGFEAGVLLPSRWPSVFEDQGLPDTADEARSWGERYVRPLLRIMQEPYPYVACLAADGDRMGRALGYLQSPEQHRQFSSALSQFAQKARDIVEDQYQGSLVYAGGDDVLAFVPLPRALGCADALRHAFVDIMASACGDAVPETDRPTLSVGIGIGHMLDSLGSLVTLGREAENLAKHGHGRAPGQDRNALAVLVDRRSGGRITWRTRWDAWAGEPVSRLQADMSLLRDDRLSTKKVHEVGRVLDRMPRPDIATGAEWANLLILDVKRTISRSHAGESPIPWDDVGLELDTSQDYAAAYATVRDWTERMLVAQTFAAAEPRPRSAQEAA